MKNQVESVIAAIQYIESNLADKLDLDTVAQGVHYSKYHLHRVFTDAVGITIHNYAQRRKLTEAAKLLVFSQKSILEIALIAGYESQQAFSTIFKQMYKRSPNQYRQAEEFYPLQLRYHLNDQPTKESTKRDWQKKITLATEGDIPDWMAFVHLVIDGFPNLQEKEYLPQLKQCIKNGQAFLIRDEGNLIGAMAYCKETGSIDFLGVHPQYRKQSIARSFLEILWGELLKDKPISITTFREGDKADLGHRAVLKELGFTEAELLVELGYPTQRFVYKKGTLGEQAP